ncbi:MULTISPECIES: hypothetical protein [Streptomyces]|uniref:Aromatic ring-opening dioxygenase LigA n=2 Tax=Streptomyces TaxID=1883 RepID=A0ABU4KF61_9ACTN|nr:hypothetical protein [Streptomyces roseolus]MDX2296164.1 hypothetical protein [Streptomyces roseolus]
MSTAPPPPNNTPHPYAGSPVGPPPPQPPPRRGWYGSLSEGGKVTVIGAVIVGVSTLAAAILPSLLSPGDGKGTGDAKPPAAQITTQEPTKTQEPTPTGESDPTGETPSQAPTATETATGGTTDGTTGATAPPASRTYVGVYQDQAMSLGLPRGDDVGSIDFDVPATRRYSDEEWTAEKEKAEQTGVPVAADLTYADTSYGYLALRNGRNAAQLQPTDPSEKGEDCARSAQVGGFTEAVMDDWTLPAQTVLCILTDQGNVARVTITGFIGGKKDGLTEPPTQISLKVTLWKPEG